MTVAPSLPGKLHSPVAMAAATFLCFGSTSQMAHSEDQLREVGVFLENSCHRFVQSPDNVAGLQLILYVGCCLIGNVSDTPDGILKSIVPKHDQE